MKNLLLCLTSLIGLPVLGQQVSGLYTGTLFNDTTKMVQQYQLALSDYKGKITGYSYTTFVVNDSFYYGIRSIKATIKEGNLFVEEDKMLVNNFPEPPARGIRRLTVIPLDVNQDTLATVNGRWETNRTKTYLPVTGSIALKRDNDSSQSALISHLKELNIINAASQTRSDIAVAPVKAPPIKTPATIPAVVTFDQRTNKTIYTHTTASDSLLLSFYDNGVVDGDVISVYVNGALVVSSTRLTELALKKWVSLSRTQDLTEIKLVAENLGTLPPNTGLLVIQDGAARYSINFSADLQTNASIIIKKKK
jgi:hypothetical protein